MTKHQPATPLPWNHSGASIRAPMWPQANGSFTLACTGDDEKPHNDANAQKTDAAYISHAANAYPKLVAVLHEALTTMEDWGPDDARSHVVALLLELGEAE